MGTRTATTGLIGVGAAAAVVTVTGLIGSGDYPAIAAVVLPLVFWAVGTVAARARPDHPVGVLLLVTGTAHLLGFALSVGADAIGTRSPWVAWTTGWASATCFVAGFAALALCFAVYPDGSLRGRSARWVAGAGIVISAVVPLLTAVTSPTVVRTIDRSSDPVPVPPPLPWGSGPVDLFFLAPALVLAGVAVLVLRARRSTGDTRRQMAWPVGSAMLLAIALVTSPAGEPVFGAAAWSVLFLVVAAAVPLALLAGLVRYRLLSVDLYVSRTVAQAVVVALVIVLYAAATQVVGWLGGDGTGWAATVAVLAALTGQAVRRRLERVVNRWLTGGRARAQDAVRELSASLHQADSVSLAQRTAETVSRGLDASFVRVVVDGGVVGRHGDEDGTPAMVTVPMTAGDEVVGALECGPRHGGWSAADTDLLEVLACHAGLALHAVRLSEQLEHQVAALEASRQRMVIAEDEGRRRVERDLHDGVQQQLVVLLARLELARTMSDPGTPAYQVISDAQALTRESLAELRLLVRGIHPPVLTDGGLLAAVQARTEGLPVAVDVLATDDLRSRRFPAAIEGAAYFVTCEALANVLKHSGATRVEVRLEGATDGDLVVTIADDGDGVDGARPGTGLTNLRDRVEGLGGQFRVAAGDPAGTVVSARWPQAVVTDA